MPMTSKNGTQQRMRTCGVSECKRRHFAHDLCKAHYDRRRHGRALGPPIRNIHNHPTRPLINRLSEKLLQGDAAECWEWLGAKDAQGYGRLSVDGKKQRVQRVLYELLVGPIPEGLNLLHWTGCVCPNPFHCYPGTQGQNIIDERLHAASARDMERESF